MHLCRNRQVTVVSTGSPSCSMNEDYNLTFTYTNSETNFLGGRHALLAWPHYSETTMDASQQQQLKTTVPKSCSERLKFYGRWGAVSDFCSMCLYHWEAMITTAVLLPLLYCRPLYMLVSLVPRDYQKPGYGANILYKHVTCPLFWLARGQVIQTNSVQISIQ